MKLTRVLVALLLFGISFGYVEAAVVVYLRAVFRPIRAEVFAHRPHDDLFPVLAAADLRAAGHGYLKILWAELGRELATLVMLAATGLVFARSFRQWLAGFMIAFGVWDVFYYVFLKVLIDWPASLGTWDVLFFVPVPWTGPVISPLLIAAAMILAGVVILWREACRQPVHARLLDWTAIFGGGLVIALAFCWDWRSTMAGGMPNSFNWPLFAFGLTIGAAGFLCALARPAAGGDS